MHMFTKALFAAGAAVMAATPAAAQQMPGSITARNPESVAAAMRYAGYPVKMTKDKGGDPMIETEFGGYRGLVLFYGCDKKTHDGCDSLQLNAGFDGKKPTTLAAVESMMQKWRFASVHLDDEDDPWVQYDIVTMDGIPAPVFLKSLEMYSWTLDEVADVVFAGED